MFKIEKGYLVFEDIKFLLPQEVRAKAPSKIFGTSTAGLQSKRGVFIDADGASGRVGLADGSVLAGHIIGNTPKTGTLIYLREQLDPSNPSKIFWLISINNIPHQLNWITIEFTDNTFIRVCPLTQLYFIGTK